MDLNYSYQDTVGAVAATRGGLDKLRAIGYVGNSPPARQAPTTITPNWSHLNSVGYVVDADDVGPVSYADG